MRRKREVIYDFKLGEASVDDNSDDEATEDVATPPTLGSEDLFTDESRTLMLQHLLQKGFCLVGLGGTHQQMVDAARLDALKLLQENEGNNFTAPPFMVADGLLGEEGSAEIMQMEGFNFTAQQKPGLGSADAFLTQIFTAASPLETMLECRLSSRSSCILHKAGIPKDSDVPELTPKECHKWLGVFGHSRLMLVLFLGPGYGRMEFQPLDVDVNSIELDVGPGTLLLLRADGLTHRFFSTARSLALSCFLMEDASQTWRRRFGTPLLVTPVCRDLMDWAKERWEHSRRSQPIGEDGQELDPNMPRQWQKMSSQVFQLGPQVAVRGTSCKMPASYSDAGFWCGAEAGCDLIEEVPLCRWDHSNFYHKDVESYQWAKTSCLHGSFIDGIELFDNKFFGISPVESRGMDPMQRHILETSYEALYFSGWHTQQTFSYICFGVHVELLQITILKLGQDMKEIMRNQVLQFHCFDFCLPTLPRWFSEEELDEVVDWSLYRCCHLRVCLCPSGGLFHVRNWRGQQYHLKSHLLLLGFARRGPPMAKFRAKSRGFRGSGWGQSMGRAYACNHVKVYTMNLYE